MRLGTIINDYRTKNGISMDEFAKRSGLSKAYVGFLEKGIHPKTLHPIRPSIDAINKCATAMGMDFTVLFNMLDEVITLNPSTDETDDPLSIEESECLKLFQNATPEMKQAALAVLKAGQRPSEPSD